MRLIGEAGVVRDFGERPPLAHALPREVQAPEHEISVRARSAAEPELASELVPRQARDRLELRRPHDARPLGVEELARPVFQWVNPKSWLVSTGAAGTFLSAEAGSPIAQAAWLGGLFSIAAFPSGLVWLAFGAGVQRVLRTHRRWRIFNVVMGTLLALSIALIARP